MQILINQTQKHEVLNETVNGLQIMVLLESAAVNTAVPNTGYMTSVGFDPSQVAVEVNLLRNGKNITILSENLAILAAYWTTLQNGYLWRKGLTLQKKAAGATHIVARSVFVPFPGHINVKGSDILTVTVTANRGTFGTGVANTSSIQVETNQSIGVEYALGKFNVESIGANKGQAVQNLGDNVTRIVLLSFETDYEKPVFKSCSLSSDRLAFTDNEQQLLLRHWDKFPHNIADNLLMATADTAQPLYFPSSLCIHDKDEIDNVKLTLTMNSPNVQESQNFICWTSYDTDQTIVAKAIAMEQNHEAKNVAKIPVQVGG